ncbi:MAG: helix-turn-helix domain-containing protein [Vicinamibacteria bacterium]
MTPRAAAADGKMPLRQRLDDLIEEMIAGGIRFPDAKREFEKRFLSQVMDQEKGNLSRAAKVLHIHRNTLSKKLQELKLWTR